ncbi:hypothetical protein [Roseovarius sp.]|uniref:hypothetical protein n=1 Tax=Roseovarius sp. TaxID=1486281 RepID=UPI00261C7632|nr:hypothetical protein [Roseovarius sp.]MDM8167000.1 hypothetical protein [Roseovarius sp.]
MNKKQDRFCEALDYYIQFPGPKTASELHAACGGVWNDKSQMQINARNDVGDAIGSFVEFGQWEETGRTYAGAARRIRPRLKAEFNLS